jgi:hypothetical protein
VVETDNLPVEFLARRSGLAPQDDHERLASLARLRLALFQAGEPPVAGGLFVSSPLRMDRRREHGQEPDGQEHGESTSH